MVLFNARSASPPPLVTGGSRTISGPDSRSGFIHKTPLGWAHTCAAMQHKYANFEMKFNFASAFAMCVCACVCAPIEFLLRVFLLVWSHILCIFRIMCQALIMIIYIIQWQNWFKRRNDKVDERCVRWAVWKWKYVPNNSEHSALTNDALEWCSVLALCVCVCVATLNSTTFIQHISVSVNIRIWPQWFSSTQRNAPNGFVVGIDEPIYIGKWQNWIGPPLPNIHQLAFDGKQPHPPNTNVFRRSPAPNEKGKK